MTPVQKSFEQGMQPVPLAAVVQIHREDEQVLTLHFGDEPGRVRTAGHEFGKLRIEAAQNRKLLHELDERSGQPPDHVLSEVVAQVRSPRHQCAQAGTGFRISPQSE
jgi:hypothetical protein